MHVYVGETYLADLEGEERLILVINEHADKPYIGARDMLSGAILRVPIENILRYHA
jgi:hypothetical protein